MLIKKIRCSDQSPKSIGHLLKEYEYSRDAGEGFKIYELNDSEIIASYIYSQPSFVNKFDENSLEYKRELFPGTVYADSR
jgi:hypothetical protein